METALISAQHMVSGHRVPNYAARSNYEAIANKSSPWQSLQIQDHKHT